MPDMQKDFNFPIARVRKKWILDSYCRLFLGSILPKEVERVLYLDCDTLCHGDLQELWDMDLQSCYCGAVTDAVGEHYYELFNMSKTSHYCNSGIVLFDLKRWREGKMENKVADYVREKNGFVFFMEQSVMNIVLQDKIKILHPKYNTYTLISGLTNQELRWLRHCKRFYSKQECDEARNDPRLIHLTNLFLIKGRPWLEGNKHPFRVLFMNYRALTPWKDEPLMIDNTSKTKQIGMGVIRAMPRWISLPIIGIVYEYIRPRQIARQHA
jgi:lipopolysaccharide biosynthesis glycosyltransferase